LFPFISVFIYQSNYKKAYIEDLNIDLARLEQNLALIVENVYRWSAVLLIDKANVGTTVGGVLVSIDFFFFFSSTSTGGI